MASLVFQLLQQNNGKAVRDNLGGSGLAFYGSTAGSSVQIGAYQDETYVANADGSSYTDRAVNQKYRTGAHPSGLTTMGGVFADASAGLSGIKTLQGTLGIEFYHTSPVNIQNAQLRVYDRSNVNYPASGVNTKVAEIINHGGGLHNSQGTIGTCSEAVGSGDALWWGEPWPAEMVSTYNYFTNSNGVVFRNGLDSETNINGDSRLSGAAIAGSYDTVGGTGIILPLANSPGSGQRGIDRSMGGTGMVWPKWAQYINATARQTLFFTDVAASVSPPQYDNAALASNSLTYGGTGVDQWHTWSVALSASPLSVGAKDLYGLYVSVEYL